MSKQCEECGALLPEGNTCQSIFEFFTTLKYINESYLQVHLPMVTCFMIQHGRYSDEALIQAKSLLHAYLERSMTVPQLYQFAARSMGINARTWKFTRLADAPSLPKVAWSMTIIDIAQTSQEGQDTERYCALVKQWARLTLQQMEAEM